MTKVIKLTLFFLLILSSSYSCKKNKIIRKTRLTGDLEYLVGYWEWTGTDSSVVHTEQNPIYDYDTTYVNVITPETIKHTYGIEFYKKGKVTFLKDGVKEMSYNVNVEVVSFLGSTYVDLKLVKPYDRVIYGNLSINKAGSEKIATNYPIVRKNYATTDLISFVNHFKKIK